MTRALKFEPEEDSLFYNPLPPSDRTHGCASPVAISTEGDSVIEQLPTPEGSSMATNEEELHALGVHSRKLIHTIQKLETLHINSTLPSLPKFVVVGDQSAGKSSIIEAICDITLPRNEGTCTRCPFQITTSASRDNEPWSCFISLLAKYAHEPAAQADGGDRWREQSSEVTPFATVKDKSQLEITLRKAQHAILNPATDPAVFATGAHIPSRKPQVQFSPNLICLEIKGPGLPELSFYDLPGSINVVANQSDQHLVRFVGRLVKNYLCDDKALILLACSADQDVENSTTFRFIRESNAEHRCLGVLTKLDLLPPSRVKLMRSMLDGTTFPLGESWFATKQLSQAQIGRGVTHDQARDLERNFFSEGIWKGELAPFSDQFGIPNLQDTISKKLTDFILADLPEIIQRVENRLKLVENELSQFREKDLHPIVTVLGVIRNISTSVNSHLQGSIEKTEFLPEYRKLNKSLRDRLKDIAPDINPLTPGFTPKPILLRETDDEDDDMPTTVTPGSSKRKTPSTPVRRSAPLRPAKRAKSEVPVSSVPSKKVFKLDEVENVYQLHVRSGLPDIQSAAVTDILIKQSLAGWTQVVKSNLAQVGKLVTEMVLLIARDELTKYSNTPLYHSTLTALDEYLTGHLAQRSDEINAILMRELHKPLTLAPMKSHRETAVALIRKKRQDQRVREFFEDSESFSGRMISDTERKKKMADDNFVQTNLGADPYEFAIQCLIDPIAYYQIAMARFTDCVALHLEHELLHAMNTDLQETLTGKLQATDAQVCDELLAEEPQLERRRQELIRERVDLMKAMEELNDLPALRQR